nr:Chain C, Tyrosinase peptide [Homo sapiens]
YMDGTMSQV